MEGLSRAGEAVRRSSACTAPSLHLLPALSSSPCVKAMAGGRANVIDFLLKESECGSYWELRVTWTQLDHPAIARTGDDDGGKTVQKLAPYFSYGDL